MKKVLIALYKLLVASGILEASSPISLHLHDPKNGLAINIILALSFILLTMVLISIELALVRRTFTHHFQTKAQADALALVLLAPFVLALAYTVPETINLMRNLKPTYNQGAHLQTTSNPGDLVWQNFRITSGSSRNMAKSVYQTQADGSIKAVSAQDGLRCNILSGANTVSVDIGCTELAGLTPGCAKIMAEIDGKSANATIRVTNPDGSGEYCPQ